MAELKDFEAVCHFCQGWKSYIRQLWYLFIKMAWIVIYALQSAGSLIIELLICPTEVDYVQLVPRGVLL